MFKKQISLLFLCILMAGSLKAQTESLDATPQVVDIFSLLQEDSHGAAIHLYQNPSLHVLVDKNSRLNEKSGLMGYRIQIYSGSGTQARDKANEVGLTFMENFPEFDPGLIYTDYQAPYFKVRIGDYRNKNEAFEFYNDLKKKYPGAYIVKSVINFPKLETPETNF